MIRPIKYVEKTIAEKVETQKPGLLEALMLPITSGFLITFSISRIINHMWPNLYFQATPTLHIHHFTYGFFLLAVACFLALLYSGPRAKFWVSLLYGVGLGFAFDEFAMWLRLDDDDPVRWNYDGFLIVMGTFILLLSINAGLKFYKRHWRSTLQKLNKNRISKAKKSIRSQKFVG